MIDIFIDELKKLEIMEILFVERKNFLENAITEKEENVQDYMKIKEIFMKVVDKQRENLKNKIEKLLTIGLQEIFEEDIKFKIDLSVKRNKLWAEFFIEKNGFKEKLSHQGGGVVNVISFLLRVMFIKLLNLKPFLILDEGFSMVSRNYANKLANFCKKINEDLGIQMIIVTHHPEFEDVADKVIRI